MIAINDYRQFICELTAAASRQSGVEVGKIRLAVTYDPNVANPRQIFIIRNKTFVCRDIEEVITAEGRQKKWKMTVYPFNMTEEEIDGWVLSHGVWEDDAPWLDDGRWNDSNPE